MSTVANQDIPLRSPLLDRIDAIDRLIGLLQERRADLLDLLTEHASYKAAQCEIDSSIKALQGAWDEVALMRQSGCVEMMAVLMPSNVILYSYILYLVIPSLYTRAIHFRPASVVADQICKLHSMLRPAHRLPIVPQAVSQSVFVERFVKAAGVVLFTGTYANAEKIKSQINSDRQVFVFLGQGVNPIVVTESADLDKAASDVVLARLFNTGQDCTGPDIIFVQEQISEAFLEKLCTRLSQLKFGSCKDPAADYSPLYYDTTIDIIARHLNLNHRFVRWGGTVDFAKRKVEPTVLCGSLEDKAEVIELFGPVFNVVAYTDDASLMRELSKGFYRERAMGASLYGAGRLLEFLQDHHWVSVDSTLLDIEDGNRPFGGYGPMANYVYHKKRLKCMPILLSQIVSEYL